MYHLRGAIDVTRARVQADCFAVGYSSALAVADAVDTALSGQIFFAGGSPPLIKVVGCFRQSRMATYEADELRCVRVMQDYDVWSKPV
jgi:hypothetical protein